MANHEPTTRSEGKRSVPPAEAALLAEVRHCRRRLTWQECLRRGLALLAAAGAFPLVVVAADHAWPGGLPKSLVAAAARTWELGLLAGVLLLSAMAAWRRLNPLFAARLLERQAGIHHNALVNALLLREAAEADYAYPAALVQAAAEVRRHPPVRLGEPGALRLPSAVGLAVVLAWLTYAIVSPKPLWPSLARFFGAELPAPTATWLRCVRPEPEQVVHEGEALVFVFEVGGRPAEDVWLEFLDPEHPEQPPQARHRLQPETGTGTHRWTITLAPHEVVGDIHYRCTANDAVLTGMVPVYPEPGTERIEIRLEPPAYTGWPARTVTRPELDVLRGTRARFSVLANTPLRDGVFVLARPDGETRTRMQVDPEDPHRLSLDLILVEGGEYRIEYSDRWGFPRQEPPRYLLTVRPDEPPVVRVVEPGPKDTPDGIVDLSRWKTLVVEAEDDVGLAELAAWREEAGVRERTPLKPQRSSDGRAGRVAVPVDVFRVLPGNAVEVWFEAQDGYVGLDGQPTPQQGRSRRLTLVRPATGKKRARARGKSARKEQTRAPVPAETDQPAQPASQPTGRAPGQTKTSPASQATSRAATTTPAGDEAFKEALRQFVQEHGQDAREAERLLREGGQPAATQPSNSAAGPNDSGEPSDAGREPTSQEHRDSEPAPGQKGSEQRGQPKDSPSTGQGGEKRASETEAEKSSQTTRPSEPDGQPDSQEASTSSDSQDSAPPNEGESAEASGSGEQGEETAQNETSEAGDESADASSKPPAEQESPSGPQAGREEAAPQGAQGKGHDQAGEEPGAGHPGSEQAEAIPDEPPDVEVEPPSSPAADQGVPESTGLEETLDLLEMLARGQTLDEDWLIERGWPPQRAAGFVRALERLHAMSRAGGPASEARRVHVTAKLGDASLQAGTGRAADLTAEVKGERPLPDGLRPIVPPPEQEVPTHLRRLLEAYYRSLAEHRGANRP